MGSPAHMRELETESKAHFFLAEQFFDNAREAGEEFEKAQEEKEKDKDKVKESLFKLISSLFLALSEYQAAIDRDPSNHLAMNGFAYTFWYWQLRWRTLAIPQWDRFETALKAERYIRQALAANTPKASSVLAIQLHSTLGEVLLAQARSREALEELQQARPG